MLFIQCTSTVSLCNGCHLYLYSLVQFGIYTIHIRLWDWGVFQKKTMKSEWVNNIYLCLEADRCLRTIYCMNLSLSFGLLIAKEYQKLTCNHTPSCFLLEHSSYIQNSYCVQKVTNEGCCINMLLTGMTNQWMNQWVLYGSCLKKHKQDDWWCLFAKQCKCNDGDSQVNILLGSFDGKLLLYRETTQKAWKLNKKHMEKDWFVTSHYCSWKDHTLLHVRKQMHNKSDCDEEQVNQEGYK